jgi:hypothetical protein
MWLWVAYLLAADIVSGPLPSRLREVTQPVRITRNQFSRPRPRLWACLGVHGAPPHDAPPPLPMCRLAGAGATAAPDPGGLLAATTWGPSTRRPSRACTAAMAWLSPPRGSAGAVATTRVSWHGASRHSKRHGTRPTAAARRPRPCTGGCRAVPPWPPVAGWCGCGAPQPPAGSARRRPPAPAGAPPACPRRLEALGGPAGAVARSFDPLRSEEPGQGPPARGGRRALCPLARRLAPLTLGGQARRRVVLAAIGEEERPPAWRQPLHDLLGHAWRPGPRAIPDVERQQPCGDGIARAPAPVGGARQPLDGLDVTPRPSLDRPAPGAECVPLPLGDMHIAQEGRRPGCGMLCASHPPRPDGMRGTPKHPRHGAAAQPGGPRAPGPPQLIGCDMLARPRRAMVLMARGAASNALPRRPGGAARVPVGAAGAASPPTVVGTIAGGTARLPAIKRALAAPCSREQRWRRPRGLGTGCCGLFTGGTPRCVEQPGKGCGLARAVRAGCGRWEERGAHASARPTPKGLAHATPTEQGHEQELRRHKVCGQGGVPSESGVMRGSARCVGALEVSVL